VKFHDGSDLASEDVLWTLDHLFGPQAVEYVGQSTLVRIARGVDRIELSGPDKVCVTTELPVLEVGDAIAETGGQWYHIMPKRATLRNEAEELAYDNDPIGAGPMKLVGHTPAQVMEFERFDDFYFQPETGLPEDRRVNFQSLDLFLMPDEATRVAAIRAGEADIVPASLATKEQVEAGGGRLVFGPEGVYIWTRLFGCYEPQYPCSDKRVRQALDYAIDREVMRDQLYGGPEVFQVKGWSVVTPSTIGSTPELDPRPFDPDKARQLLADAGYPGGEGFGKLIVHTNPSIAMPFVVEAAQLAADSWIRELGLDVEVRVGDDSGLKKLEISGGLNGQIWWRDNEARKDPLTVLGRYGDPENPSRLSEDPEITRLVQETVQIVDPDQRAEAYKKLFSRLRDESYELSLGYVNIPWAVGPRVQTWSPYPLSPWVSALHTITLK
jgi:peptide/nickel transport system substrate-binding protein